MGSGDAVPAACASCSGWSPTTEHRVDGQPDSRGDRGRSVARRRASRRPAVQRAHRRRCGHRARSCTPIAVGTRLSGRVGRRQSQLARGRSRYRRSASATPRPTLAVVSGTPEARTASSALATPTRSWRSRTSAGRWPHHRSPGSGGRRQSRSAIAARRPVPLSQPVGVEGDRALVGDDVPAAANSIADLGDERERRCRRSDRRRVRRRASAHRRPATPRSARGSAGSASNVSFRVWRRRPAPRPPRRRRGRCSSSTSGTTWPSSSHRRPVTITIVWPSAWACAQRLDGLLGHPRPRRTASRRRRRRSPFRPQPFLTSVPEMPTSGHLGREDRFRGSYDRVHRDGFAR